MLEFDRVALLIRKIIMLTWNEYRDCLLRFWIISNMSYPMFISVHLLIFMWMLFTEKPMDR